MTDVSTKNEDYNSYVCCDRCRKFMGHFKIEGEYIGGKIGFLCKKCMPSKDCNNCVVKVK